MPGIALLPDDLMSEILLLASDKSIDDKFAVAQVSRHWRGVALAAPLMWSSFRLATQEDRFRLPILLERSCTCALDIALRPISRNPVDPTLMAILAQHTARIRGLEAWLYSGRKHEQFAPLLNAELHFPILETLRVTVGPASLRIATAPALRVLRLAMVDIDPATLVRVLGQQLETLELILCTPIRASDLLPIAIRCPMLAHIDFRAASHSKPAFVAPLSVPHRPIATNLRSLDLWLSGADTLEVLSMGFSSVPREIVARVTGRLSGADMARLCDALLDGADSPVALEVKSHKKLVLRDAVGRVRTLSVVDQGLFLDIRDIWRGLATRNSLCTSLQTLEFPTSHWNVLSDALAEHPLRPSNGVQLHIELNTRPDVGERQSLRRTSSPEWRDLTVGKLDRVELVSLDGSPSLPDVVTYILKRIHCNHTRLIRVIITGSPDAELDVEGTRAYQTLVKSRAAQEARGNWEVSFEDNT